MSALVTIVAIALEIHGSLAQSKGLWIDSWECRAVCFAPRSEIAWLFVEALYEKSGIASVLCSYCCEDSLADDIVYGG